MPQLNENFLKLEKNYLFINIAKKIAAFKESTAVQAMTSCVRLFQAIIRVSELMLLQTR